MITQPTRSLIGPRPSRYIKSEHTDIRRTFRKFRLLARIRALMASGCKHDCSQGRDCTCGSVR